MAAVVPARRGKQSRRERAVHRAVRIGAARSKNMAVAFFRVFSFSFPLFG